MSSSVLKTKEFSRFILRTEWGVTDVQLAVLAILCGKTSSKFDQDRVFIVDRRHLDFPRYANIVKARIPASLTFNNNAGEIFDVLMRNLDDEYKQSITNVLTKLQTNI